MAKQHVTFVERHWEKCVVGATGAVLLATIVFYWLSTPHGVDVRGENLGPQELYDRIRQQAEAAREQMKRAEPETTGPQGSVLVVPDVVKQRSPYEAERLPTQFAVPFVPLGPAVPEIKGEQRGKIRLAEILAPSPVVVTTGRAVAKLSPPTVLNPTNPRGAQESPSAPATPQDVHWVTVVAAVHRKEQRARFDQAQYAFERQNMIVAGVEAQRQERLPRGQWGPAQIVTGYAGTVVPVVRKADLVRQDDGSWVIRDQKDIDAYKQLLAAADVQSTVLRPPFQSLLDFPLDWQVPPSLAGVSVNLADYGAVIESAGPSRPALRPGRETPAQEPRKLSPPLLLRQAKQAADRKQYVEAETLLNQVGLSDEATPRQKEEAQSLLRQWQADILAARAQVEAKAGAARSEPDIEPLWLTDLRVNPGTTYRYRVRLLVFNPYVGFASQLENPEEAGVVVVEGQWSEWSEPIEVKPASYLFVTSGREDTNSMRVEMRDWVGGSWATGTQDVRHGDALDFTVGRHAFSYGALVTRLDLRVNYPERTVGRDGQLSYQDKTTAGLVLLKAGGEIEERTAAQDNARKRELLAEIREYQKRRDAWTSHPQTPSPVPERRQLGEPRPGPRVGPRGDEDER